MKKVEIFTDGACSGNPGPGGWGAVLRFGGREKELCGGDDDTTNNRMELTACIEALSALKETAKRTCKRLRIDPLEILVVFGGTDPADIAQTYGYASAAMWGVMPHLEDLFHIPDPSLHLRMDYSSEKTHAEGAVGLSLRIRDGLHIALALLIPMLKWYLRYKKAHKNDAPAEKPTESTPQNSEHGEKLTA